MPAIQLHSQNSSGQSGISQGFLARQIDHLAGVALGAIALFIVISLATWSVEDPSLSYAVGHQPSNLGGYPGAVMSDLLMQFTGLAGTLLVLPVTAWAWLKFTRRRISAISKRGVAGLLAIILTAAAFGCLPRPQAFPLPNGLGGVIGDLVLSIPAVVTGGWPAGLTAAFLFMVFVLPAIGLTLFSTALFARPDRFDDELEFAGDDDGEGAEVGLFLGALTHWYLMGKHRLRRVLSFGRANPATDFAKQGGAPQARFWPELMSAFAGPDQQPSDLHGRVEPAFAPPGMYDDGGFAGNTPTSTLGSAGDLFPDGGSDGEGVVPGASRVRPPAPKPKPGTRMVREAQVSMFSQDAFELPSLGLLTPAKTNVVDRSITNDALEQNARLLEGVLEDFGVRGEIINVHPGPVVTLYELEPAPGIKSARVIGLADDIARSMSAIAARVAVIPGRNAIGIELPNQRRQTVFLRELLASRDFETAKGKLPLCLGKTIGGTPVIADLAKMPHLLVAGTTGSGKSVSINTMILSILYRLSPEQCKLIMIDPKMLELSIYDGIPHLLTPVVTDPKKAVVALKWTVREMENRYKRMSKLGVRNIDGFNVRLGQARAKGESLTRTVQTGFDRQTGEAIYEVEELELEPMPFIVVVIDEMADLMMVAGKDIEGTVQRLAQMARAAGIHVIMATQRPSVDVITGTIKANFPTRISFQVTSKIDSRTILGEQGAEQLLGMGDMLYMAGGGRIQRVHGPFVDDNEVESVVAHLKDQGLPQYLESVTEDDDDEQDRFGLPDDGVGTDDDEPYDRAVAIVLKDRKVSTSYIQRRLSIGYNRAATLIERMEEEGVISAANHAGKREILVGGDEEVL